MSEGDLKAKGYLQSKESGDQAATTSAGSRHDIRPAHLRGLHLDLERCLDLGELCLDELGVDVSLGVVLNQNRLGLICTILRDEPSGTIRQEAA